MTKEETIKCIRFNIDAEDYTLKYLNKYIKGYVRGLIAMAEMHKIISAQEAEMLEGELEDAVKEGKAKLEKL